MQRSATTVPDSRQGLARRIWIPRVIGLGFGALLVATALVQQRQNAWLMPAVIVHGLLWPHVAYLRSRGASNERRSEGWNLLADAFMGGFWVAPMSFNPVTSGLVLAMMAMNNASVGGPKLFRRGLLAQLAGVAVGTAVVGVSFVPSVTAPMALACMPFLLAYPITTGFAAFSLARRLQRKTEELRQSEQLHASTLHALDAGVVLWDADGRLMMCTDHFRQLYGPIADQMVPGLAFEQLLREAVRHGLVPVASGQEEA